MMTTRPIRGKPKKQECLDELKVLTDRFGAEIFLTASLTYSCMLSIHNEISEDTFMEICKDCYKVAKEVMEEE